MNRLICALAFSLLLAAPVAAGPVTLYDNGPATGNYFAWSITGGYEVSNSFTLSSTSSLTGVQFGTQEVVNTAPPNGSSGLMTSVQWTISTSPAGNMGPNYTNGPSGVIASGTANVSDRVIMGNLFSNVSLNEVNFSLSNLPLGPGTYYLTLTDTNSADLGQIYWDQSNGPSTAYQTGQGLLNGADLSSYGITGYTGGSESFQIFGAVVPEPSTAVVLGGILVLAAASIRRRELFVRS